MRSRSPAVGHQLRGHVVGLAARRPRPELADGISDSIPLGLVFDAAGEPKGAISLIAVISLMCVALGRWRLALLTVAGQGLIGSMTNLVKPLFDRTIHGPFLSFPERAHSRPPRSPSSSASSWPT